MLKELALLEESELQMTHSAYSLSALLSTDVCFALFSNVLQSYVILEKHFSPVTFCFAIEYGLSAVVDCFVDPKYWPPSIYTLFNVSFAAPPIKMWCLFPQYLKQG